jgi:hypothetical protein
VQRAQHVAWGDPTSVLEPLAGDDGRRWWQVRYADGAQGEIRVILVDDASGWGRLPPAGYQVRVPPAKAATVPQQPTQAEPGSWVLRLTEPTTLAADADAALDREATRLNALAGQTGIYPLFRAHRDEAGRTTLLYGWQGDRGIAQDDAVTRWVATRTTYATARWVDLLADTAP